MGKFTEQTNIHGLPLHPIAKPVRGEGIRESAGTLEEVSTPAGRKLSDHLRELLASEPLLEVRGLAGAGCRIPFRVVALAPQSRAELAQALDLIFWPPKNFTGLGDAELTILQIPSSEDQILLSLPALGLALILGSDDLRPGLLIALESAHRFWNKKSQTSELKSKEEEIRLLPGGSFLLQDSEGKTALVFSGESVPDQWEKTLVEKIPELARCNPSEIVLAGAEPWIAQGGGWVSPFWRNPFFPASLLSSAPRWSEAALHPDSIPFGVPVNAQGEIKLTDADENAFAVIPRSAIPTPFVSSGHPAKISRLLTHRHSKNEAMELWAKGFPPPEIV